MAEPDAAAPVGQVLLDFVILPEQYGQTKSVDVQQTIGEVQKQLEKELQIPDGSLVMSNLTGVVNISGVLDTSKTLYELGLNPNDKAGIELRISYYEEQPAAEYTMPDVLEITCKDELGKEELRELRRTIVDLSEHSSDCPSISPRGLTQTVAAISGER